MVKSTNAAKKSTTNSKETPFKGNEFVTAEQQKAYADVYQEIKAHPILGKMVIGPMADWSKVNAIISFLILKEMERK